MNGHRNPFNVEDGLGVKGVYVLFFSIPVELTKEIYKFSDLLGYPNPWDGI